MIVVADSSPFVLLANIGRVDLLEILFQAIAIPPEVAAVVNRYCVVKLAV